MKIYTRTGDKGKTSLFSGERISKSHDRVDTYGEVDELNACIGLIAASLAGEEKAVLQDIHAIQHSLFIVGSWLATTADTGYPDQLPPMTPGHITGLEAGIDRMNAELPDLRAFILPGGGLPAAHAHLARTVCRRVERHVVRLVESDERPNPLEEQMALILKYLNRLSDYFFVLARYCNMNMDIPDIEYTPPAAGSSDPA